MKDPETVALMVLASPTPPAAGELIAADRLEVTRSILAELDAFADKTGCSRVAWAMIRVRVQEGRWQR